ncbi:MAG: FAD-dependent oxidoreductase, partial [Leptospiraceae bacterium]|nr:FAD-dependent oxidoreductase [Leptospiraceae bacterium]
ARLGNENGTDNDTLSAKVTAEYDSRNRSGSRDFFLKTGVQDVLASEYHQVIPLILYNQVVSKIDYSQATIRITTNSGASFEADKVIITVPLSVLKKDHIQFIPKLPLKHQEAIQKIGFDAGMKIIIKFKRQFWPSDMETLTCAGIVPEFWPTGRGRGENLYLTGFVMGKNARYLSSLPNNKLLSEVLTQLDGIFGNGVATKNFVKHIVMDWRKEEHIMGAYSFTSVGSGGAFEVLSEPISDRLHLAGEFTRSDGTHQTVHGAMLSGLDAAGKILV